jgi:periplasmic protein TonB
VSYSASPLHQPKSHVLHWALGVSILLHALLLSIRFVDPQAFDRVFQDTPLEVILVNARSDERPDQAKAIAQASLAGGGELEQGRATSPLPPSALTEIGDASEDAEKRNEQMQQQQSVLLANQSPESAAREERRKQLIKLLAEIEKRINEENARPKRRYISPATREEAYAVYYDGLRRKIEDKGTENFPQLAGQKLYGELTMVVTVNHDGRVLATSVVQTSGNLTLDRRAQAIAKGAGPFGSFSDEMRRKADQIVVVSRFKFTKDDTLETKLTSR